MRRFETVCALLLILFSTSLLCACSSDDDKTVERKEPDRYYVRYEAENGSQISYDKTTTREVTLKNVYDEEKLNLSSGEWSATYGPFRYGVKVYLKIKTVGKYNSNARICVSKNQEPFVIKAEQRESTNIELEYTINF